MRRAAFLIAATAGLCACASSPEVKATQLPARKPVPTVVTDGSYDEVLRGFYRLSPRSPQRAEVRQRLAAHLIAQLDHAIGDDDYDAVVARLGELSALYTPDELAAPAFPRELERAARHLVTRGSPRGDEARVLTGLLVLALVHDDETHLHAYEKLVDWTFSARADMSGPLERFEEGLVEVWEEHARLLPLPRVTDTLVRLYVERRDALLRLFQSGQEQLAPSPYVFQGVQQTAVSVAGIYLRQGDLAQALSRVRALGHAGGIEEGLAQVLQQALGDDAEASGALLDLSRLYLEKVEDPAVARGLCRVGLRAQPEDARFPQCLARIAVAERDYAGALAWYADALALVPEERGLYDEILSKLAELIEQGLFASHPSDTRALSLRAIDILKERMRRWPDAEPPVAPQDLYVAIGTAAMNAGDIKEAERYFEESARVKPTVATYLQLGQLLSRLGRGAEAAKQYEKALAQIDGEQADRKRAEVLTLLADAQRLSGSEGARASYEQALGLWDAELAGLRGRAAGQVELRRGVLLGRLSRAQEAKAAFRRAMELAPSARETYAIILSYLAVSAPDSELAQEVFHNARNQALLEPEWSVYFALWVGLVAGRGGETPPAVVGDALAGNVDASGWPSQLARFGAGKLDYSALLQAADSVGTQAEAHFYEGCRRLSRGDTEGAREMFDKVLQTRMVSFYEFAMAQELLAVLTPAPR